LLGLESRPLTQSLPDQGSSLDPIIWRQPGKPRWNWFGALRLPAATGRGRSPSGDVLSFNSADLVEPPRRARNAGPRSAAASANTAAPQTGVLAQVNAPNNWPRVSFLDSRTTRTAPPRGAKTTSLRSACREQSPLLGSAGLASLGCGAAASAGRFGRHRCNRPYASTRSARANCCKISLSLTSLAASLHSRRHPLTTACAILSGTGSGGLRTESVVGFDVRKFGFSVCGCV
jgi:hypothetical protein